MDDNKNLILATVLSFAVIIGWTFFFAPEDVAPADAPSDQIASPAAPNVARRGALASRHVRHVCLSNIAIVSANGIIGQSIKKIVNNVPPRYTMRRCSRTRLRRNVPFVLPTKCRYIYCLVKSDRAFDS